MRKHIAVSFLIALVALGCGGEGSETNSVFVSGDNSQGSIAGSDSDQTMVTVTGDPEMDAFLDQFCREFCISRGNAPEDVTADSGCYRECLEDEAAAMNPEVE